MEFKRRGQPNRRQISDITARHDSAPSTLLQAQTDTTRTPYNPPNELAATTPTTNGSMVEPDAPAAAPVHRRRPIVTKKTMLITGGIIAGISLVLVIGSSIRQYSHDNSPSNTATTPSYQTILPHGKSISQLGGWQRISPPKNDPVFAYLDTISGVGISVSQQPLPKSLGGGDDQVAELAKKFNATTTLDASDVKVYLGTSAKGPQSVIFSKNSLLILIKSRQKIDNKAWATYIKSLN